MMGPRPDVRWIQCDGMVESWQLIRDYDGHGCATLLPPDATPPPGALDDSVTICLGMCMGGGSIGPVRAPSH